MFLEKEEEENLNSDSENEEQDLVFQDMQLFCHAIGEPQLADLFLKNKVNLGQLLEMDEQDLINCGVELVGDRKKILTNTGQMHCEKWMPTSLHDMTIKSMLSSPGIYISINDMNKHIEYIGATLKYIRRRLKEKPEILELGKDFVGVAKVDSELDDLIITSKETLNQICFLKKAVSQYKKNPALMPANHIDDQYLRRAKFKTKAIQALFATIIISLSFKIIKTFVV